VLRASLAVETACAQDRLAAALGAGGLAAWFAYTRAYWTLVPIHATLPVCPFLALTGHPCPFCGGTRSFASVWQGDLGRALRLYPLGPLLFAGALLALPVLLWTALSGRRPSLRLPYAQERRAYLAVGGLFAASWALKLTVLGN
jgi:uncharacterized protein DUF2752